MGSSLDTNPPNADRHITAGGSDWLWAVFALMLLSDLAFMFWSFKRHRGTRLFHQIAIAVLTTMTITYYSMASDLGATPVATEFRRHTGNTRQIWFVRYIQWFIISPLLLLALLLPSGLSLSDILTTLFMGCFVIVATLVAALTSTAYKWGFFALAMLALFYVWHSLLAHGRGSTFAAGNVVRSSYTRGAGMLSFLFLLYAICWGLSEGGNVISPNGEMIWYGILDILVGPVFLFTHLWSLRTVEYGTFGFGSGRYTDHRAGHSMGVKNGAGTTGYPDAAGVHGASVRGTEAGLTGTGAGTRPVGTTAV